MPKLYKFKPLTWEKIPCEDQLFGIGAERAKIFQGYITVYRYGDEGEWWCNGYDCTNLHMSKRQAKAMANRIVRDIAKDFLEEVRPPRKRGKR
jgi:hypothetical protein